MSIVHNGLRVARQPVERLSADGIGPVKVGFLGVLIPLKGIFELVEAMRILKSRGVSIQCLVAGENAREISGLKAWILRKDLALREMSGASWRN